MTTRSPLTYRDAGVDADLGDTLVDDIQSAARATLGPGVVSGVGGFASLFSLKDALRALAERGIDWASMDDPLLVAGTDGVGTKLKLAFAMDRHDTIGTDLVAMCVNDVVTTGAAPLFFLDYYGTGHLELGVASSVIRGIAAACAASGLSLVGGETAELPGLYARGEYDLAGFAVGVVDRARVIDGRDVQVGDVVLGLASSGLHSNGYSLARRVLLERAGLTLDQHVPELGGVLGEVLLAPTKLYTRAVEALLRVCRPRALAHVTGGGIPGNLPRVLPRGVVARLDRAAWPRPPIFDLIAAHGPVERDELERTFNVGLGFLIVVAPDEVETARAALASAGELAHVVGQIDAGEPGAEAVARLEG